MLKNLTKNWRFWVAVAAFCVLAVVGIAFGTSYALEEVPNPQAGMMPAECAKLLKEIGMNEFSPCPTSPEDLSGLMQRQFPDADPIWWVKFRDAALSGCPNVCTRASCACEYNIRALRGAYSDYLGEVAAQAAAEVPDYGTSASEPNIGAIVGLFVWPIVWVTLYFSLWGIFQIEIFHEWKIKASLLLVYLALVEFFPEVVTFGTVTSETLWIFSTTIAIIMIQPLLGIFTAGIGYFNSEVVGEFFHEVPPFSMLWTAGKAADAGVAAPGTLIGNLSSLAFVIVVGVAGYLGIDFLHAFMPILFGVSLAPGLTKIAGVAWSYYTMIGNAIKMGVFDRGDTPKSGK